MYIALGKTILNAIQSDIGICDTHLGILWI